MEPHTDFDYEEVDRDLGLIPPEADRSEAVAKLEFALKQAIRMLGFALQRQEDTAWKWGIMFAIADPDCCGRSMADKANELGVTRSLLSARATEFCEHFHLPPSSYMRTALAAAKAREAREKYVKGNGNKGSKHGARRPNRRKSRRGSKAGHGGKN